MEDFLLRAFLAGIAIAIIAGPLGCFIVWRKMAYFGDSLAHSSLLGISLGLIYGINLNFSILVVAISFALILIYLESKSSLPVDSILGILSHFSLALGVLLLYVLTVRSFDLDAYLFGDILLVSQSDLIWIYVGVIVGLILLILNWSSLIFYIINRDLAKAYGVKTFRLEVLLNLITALVIAVSIQIVGVLLITSLLIIPAACAKLLAKSSIQMAILASLIALIATFFGLMVSINLDAPSGASIVMSLAVIFILILFITQSETRLRP